MNPLPLTLLAIAASAPALEDWRLPDMRDRDKQLHAVGGFVIGAGTRELVEHLAPGLPGWGKQAVSIGAAALVGVAKEMLDEHNREAHCVDPGDAMATALGGLGGSLAVTWTLRW